MPHIAHFSRPGESDPYVYFSGDLHDFVLFLSSPPFQFKVVDSCHKVAAARQEPVNDRPVYAETTAAKVAAAEVEKSQCFLFMWFFLSFFYFHLCYICFFLRLVEYSAEKLFCRLIDLTLSTMFLLHVVSQISQLSRFIMTPVTFVKLGLRWRS